MWHVYACLLLYGHTHIDTAMDVLMIEIISKKSSSVKDHPFCHCPGIG
jgi:hypothetical protein